MKEKVGEKLYTDYRLVRQTKNTTDKNGWLREWKVAKICEENEHLKKIAEDLYSEC